MDNQKKQAALNAVKILEDMYSMELAEPQAMQAIKDFINYMGDASSREGEDSAALTDGKESPAIDIDALHKIIWRLEKHNEWRRGADLTMSVPAQLGKDIDVAIRACNAYAAQFDKKGERK